MCNKEDYIQKAHIVNNEMKAQLNRKSLKYNWHEADVTVLEGVFARGDRKVSKVILEAYKMGCLYDSWSEFLIMRNGWRHLKRQVLILDFIICGREIWMRFFPWDFINIGVTKKFFTARVGTGYEGRSDTKLQNEMCRMWSGDLRRRCLC